MEIAVFISASMIAVFTFGMLALGVALVVALYAEYRSRHERISFNSEQKTIPPPPAYQPPPGSAEARVFARPRLPTPPRIRPRLYTPPPAEATPDIPPDTDESQPDEIPTEDDRNKGPRPILEDPSDGGSNITLMEFVTPAPARPREETTVPKQSTFSKLFRRPAGRTKTTRGDR